MNTSLKALYNRLRSSARDLRTANSGNITVIFALSIIPIVGLVGAAVDYSHANSVKAAMQAAADATALMLSKIAPTIDHFDAADQGQRLLQGAVSPPGSNRPHHQRVLQSQHQRRLAGCRHRLGRRQDQLHGLMGVLDDAGRRPTPWSSGATPSCASRWCSTTPARWPTTARSPR